MKQKEESCYYEFDSQGSWARTKAKRIIEGPSAASFCLEKGEPVFLADKFSASKNNKYYISERDSRMKDGSVYCHPVFVKLPDCEDKYVITAVTYNKKLCSPNDEVASKIAESILREISRRIELELTLLSIRAWQFHE